MIARLISWLLARWQEPTTRTGLTVLAAVGIAAAVPSQVLAEYGARITQLAALAGALHLIVAQQTPPENRE